MDKLQLEVSLEERASRLKLFTRFFWMIVLVWPMYIWMIFISIVLFLHWFVILFTGRFMPALWRPTGKFFVYMTRLNAWLYLLTDRRPYLFKDGDSGPTQK